MYYLGYREEVVLILDKGEYHNWLNHSWLVGFIKILLGMGLINTYAVPNKIKLTSITKRVCKHAQSAIARLLLLICR